MFRDSAACRSWDPSCGNTAGTRRTSACGSWLVDLHQPDVPELHRVAMVLKEDGAGLGGIAATAGAGVVTIDGDVVVDLDAVVVDSHADRLDLLAIPEYGAMELDVIRLPNGRRLAG